MQRWISSDMPTLQDRCLPYAWQMSIESESVVPLYERHADAWVRARLLESTLYEKPWLDRFCELLPSAGSVLDCGCGAGEPIARYLHQSGFAVMGIDSSPAMVRMFQARLPGQRAVVADMRTLSPCGDFSRHPCVGQSLSSGPQRSAENVSNLSESCRTTGGTYVYFRTIARGDRRAAGRGAALSCEPGCC